MLPPIPSLNRKSRLWVWRALWQLDCKASAKGSFSVLLTARLYTTVSKEGMVADPAVGLVSHLAVNMDFVIYPYFCFSKFLSTGFEMRKGFGVGGMAIAVFSR